MLLAGPHNNVLHQQPQHRAGGDPATRRRLQTSLYLRFSDGYADYGVMYESWRGPELGSSTKLDVNQIFNEARVFTPKDTARSSHPSNSDTPYSFLWMDMRAGAAGALRSADRTPTLLRGCNSLNMYTFSYGYIGSRTTGNDGGCYMVAGPDWKGETPQAASRRCSAARHNSRWQAIERSCSIQPIWVTRRRSRSGLQSTVSVIAFPCMNPRRLRLHADRFSKSSKNLAKSNPFGYLNFVLQFCPTEYRKRLPFAPGFAESRNRAG